MEKSGKGWVKKKSVEKTWVKLYNTVGGWKMLRKTVKRWCPKFTNQYTPESCACSHTVSNLTYSFLDFISKQVDGSPEQIRSASGSIESGRDKLGLVCQNSVTIGAWVKSEATTMLQKNSTHLYSLFIRKLKQFVVDVVDWSSMIFFKNKLRYTASLYALKFFFSLLINIYVALL